MVAADDDEAPLLSLAVGVDVGARVKVEADGAIGVDEVLRGDGVHDFDGGIQIGGRGGGRRCRDRGRGK